MSPPRKHLVVLGVGHTNAQIVRRWREQPIPGVQLTCVSNHARATYSGMLPGVLAGAYPSAAMEIDLGRLCAEAGARLVVDDVCGLDHASQALRFADRPPMPFDVLAVGIGSVPSFSGVDLHADAPLVPIKPMQTLVGRLEAALRRAACERVGAPIRVIIVGGGAGGTEVAFALPQFVASRLGETTRLEQTIVTSDMRLVPGSLESTSRRVAGALSRRDVQCVLGRRVVHVQPHGLLLDDGSSIDADVILWATGASAPPLLAMLGLPLDERGFLLTADTLQSTSGLPVFAVGDAGSIVSVPLPKAGVYAVRQGPVLWDNIHHLLAGCPLRPYTPQRGFLKLLNTGDGRAIGEWKGVSFEGRWSWRLKDAIDTRFMNGFKAVSPQAP